MKKFKIICLTLLIFACGMLFSACGNNEISVSRIYLSDYEQTGSTIEILTSQKLTFDVTVNPENATNKKYSASIMNSNKQDRLSFEYDFENLTLSITATETIVGNSETVSVKLASEQSGVSSTFSVRIVKPEDPQIEKLSSPEISVDGNAKLHWNYIEGATGYYVQLFSGEEVIKDQVIVDQLELQLDTNALAGKSLTAKIQAKGISSDLDSEFSILNFDILATPTQLRYSDATKKIEWQAVEHANGYDLQIGSKIVHANTNEFDATGYFDVASSTKISVKAVGSSDNRYLTGKSSSQITIVKLQTVENLAFENDVLSWDSVMGSTGYSISISDGERVVEDLPLNSVSVNLAEYPIPAGDYIVGVRATYNQVSENIFVIASDAKKYSLKKLPQVTGLQNKDGKLIWDSTAVGYRIYVDGSVFAEVRSNSFDYSAIASKSMVHFNIVAIGDSVSSISSNKLFATDLEIYKLESPLLTFDGSGNISWNVVENASGYKIVVDSTIEIKKLANQTSANVVYGSVDYSIPTNISFVVLGTENQAITSSQQKLYISSNVEERKLTKLSTVNLQYGKENGVESLIWSGSNRGGYKIFATDGTNEHQSEVIFANSYAVSNFVTSEHLTVPKEYQATIKVLASSSTDKNWYLDSDLSRTVTINKLPQVSFAVENGVLFWSYDEIDDILGYQATIISDNDSNDLPEMSVDINSFDFAKQEPGTYTFELYTVADTVANYISSEKATITITKLAEIPSLKLEKVMTSINSFDDPSDKYIISFNDVNDGNAIYTCLINGIEQTLAVNGNKYSIEISDKQIGENLSVVIEVKGNNTSYINSNPISIDIQKLNVPVITSNNEGTALKSNVNNFLAFIKSEPDDIFRDYHSAEFSIDNEKNFKVKAVSFDEEKTARNGDNVKVDSAYSEIYRVSKLATPVLYVQEGVLKVKSTDESVSMESFRFNCKINQMDSVVEFVDFENMNDYILESYGTCVVSGFFTDQNTGSMNHGVIYLKSDVSQQIKVEQLPTPNVPIIRDGMVYISFDEGKVIDGGHLEIYVNDLNVMPDDNTNAQYDFEANHKQGGEYSVNAKVVSNMSGDSSELIYKLNGSAGEALSVIKLAQVTEISVTTYADSGSTVRDFGMALATDLAGLPNSMPYRSGAIRWRAVENAVKYLISDATSSNKMQYVFEEPKSDGYIYVSLQNTDFAAGVNNIIVTAIGNQREIIDSEESDTFRFTKLKTPTNFTVSDGVITWNDTNSPNNSGLNNSFGLPTWLIDSSKNAFTYYVIINGKYACVDDLTALMSADIDSLNGLAAELKDLSYEPTLASSNVYTIQICVVPFNTYVAAGLADLGDSPSDWNVATTDNIYVMSDFSTSILVRPANSPYSLTVDDRVLSWINPYANPNSQDSINLANAGFAVSGYEVRLIHIYEEDGVRMGTLTTISINNPNTTSWDFGQYLQNTHQETKGQYIFNVRTLVTQTGTVNGAYYVNSAYSLSFTSTALVTPNPGIYKGKVAWEKVNDSTGYAVEVDGVEYDTYYNADMFDVEDGFCIFKTDIFDSGVLNIRVRATGGDEKYLLSSPYCQAVSYTKLKDVSLRLDELLGIVNYDVEEQFGLSSSAWSYKVYVNEYEAVDNEKLTSFDLSTPGNIYLGGQLYTISVAAINNETAMTIPEENDFSSMILNSNRSDPITLYKIIAPSQFSMDDNYQSLRWTNRDPNISGVTYLLKIADSDINNEQNSQYNFVSDGEVNAVVSVKATYSGKVIIDGVEYGCLKSNANEYVTVHKLSTPTGIVFEDGVIRWVNSGSADVETHFVIDNLLDISDNQIDYYDFANQAPGLYNCYLYNKIKDSMTERTSTEIYLSSRSTDVYPVEKLATPTNFEIVQTYDTEDDLEKKYTLTFNNIPNTASYLITILNAEGESIYSEKLTSLPVNNGLIEVTLNNALLAENMDIINSGDFSVYVKAIGTSFEMNQFITNYASSNINYLAIERIDATESIVNEISLILSSTGVPELAFTGHVDWNSVDDAVGYYVEVEYIDELVNDVSEYVFINNGTEEFVSAKKKVYSFDRTFCQFGHSGNYRMKVVALPDIVPAEEQSDKSYSKVLQSSAIALDDTLFYLLFPDGDGTASNPYIVSTFEQFACIRFNMYANYQVKEGIDIDYADGVGYGREFVTIPEFYGELDGNNSSLKLVNANNYAGVVNVLHETAIIKNLTVSGTVASLAEGEINAVIGGIAAYNYGSIEGCLNKLSLNASNLTNNSTVGGIAGINYGQIKYCGNIGLLTGNIVGGIAGKMFGNLIAECYNGIGETVSVTGIVASLIEELGDLPEGTDCTIVGGIVGYQEDGNILSCYTYSNVYGNNSTTGVSYVGGIAGYVAGEVNIKNSYAVDNYNSNDRIRLIRSSVADRAFIGILVGYIASEQVAFLHCCAVYNNSTRPEQIRPLAVGSGYDFDAITDGSDIVGVYRNGSTEYRNIYGTVSIDNEGVYKNNANNFATLTNAKYN